MKPRFAVYSRPVNPTVEGLSSARTSDSWYGNPRRKPDYITKTGDAQTSLNWSVMYNSCVKKPY